jgi:hypothetical protein
MVQGLILLTWAVQEKHRGVGKLVPYSMMGQGERWAQMCQQQGCKLHLPTPTPLAPFITQVVPLSLLASPSSQVLHQPKGTKTPSSSSSSSSRQTSPQQQQQVAVWCGLLTQCMSTP